MTLREFVLMQSTLATGNTVREHILHPSSGGGVGQVISNLDGTVITTFNITGNVELEKEISGVVIEEYNIAGIVTEDDISAEIETNNLEGKIT